MVAGESTPAWEIADQTADSPRSIRFKQHPETSESAQQAETRVCLKSPQD